MAVIRSAGGTSLKLMSLQKLYDVSALLKAHRLRSSDGFPHLTQTPSSGTIQFLDCFGTLAAADRDSLLAAHAEVDALTLFPDKRPVSGWRRWFTRIRLSSISRQAMQSVGGSTAAALRRSARTARCLIPASAGRGIAVATTIRTSPKYFLT